MNAAHLTGKSMILNREPDGDFAREARNKTRAKAYDIDMLYVECRCCGKPVIWEQGRTRALIAASGIDMAFLDAHCLLLSDGCPVCAPESSHFQMHMVRLAAFSAQDIFMLGDAKGNA